MSGNYERENKDIDSGLNSMMNEIYVNISMNWDSIKKNDNIMNTLDINTNTLCKKLKSVHNELNDDMIKMRTFTIMMMLFMMVCFPTNYQEIIQKSSLLDDSCQLVDFTQDLDKLSTSELNSHNI